MLRIHLSEADHGRIRVASGPDPMWEIAMSLHRFQTRRGRWAFAAWYRSARQRLRQPELNRDLRLLLPLFPRAVYFPDFLTPSEARDGLDAGVEAVLSAPRSRVRGELTRLSTTVDGTPAWLARLADGDGRTALATALRTYHDAVIAPYQEDMQAAVDADRAFRARAILDAGADGLLRSLGPGIRWRPPVLEVDYCCTRELYLDGRGLLLVPSYFDWQQPVALADPALPPVLIYPVHHERPLGPEDRERLDTPLATLLGRNRAAILHLASVGATGAELARALGVSPGTVTFHTRALREANLITSRRHAATVLHSLTPLGAALLRARPAGSQ
ncbi:ArsR/SmtB family transcription factor [Streptomyces sp. NPDC019531]|uniref:ArsR/SmtB family transcription factor n=1 Tax=Streptomyces sp. NPDC019531 TaxID=3365062 RepID=UPI00384BA682